MRVKEAIAVALLALSFATVVAADDLEDHWGVSLYTGLYNPKMRELNAVLEQPYIGVAQVVNDEGTSVTTLVTYDSPVATFAPSSLTGLEFQWRINDKYALLMGGSFWEAYSTGSSTGQIPVEGGFSGIQASRTDNLYYTEFFLGLRDNFYTKPKRFQFYWSTTLHQLFNVHYRETFSTVFVNGPPASFSKSMVTTAQATGVNVLEGMAGGEWFFTKWFSVSAEGGYDWAVKRASLINGQTNTDILATDELTLRAPAIPDANTRLAYQPVAGGSYYTLNLDFTGWKALLKATLYY